MMIGLIRIIMVRPTATIIFVFTLVTMALSLGFLIMGFIIIMMVRIILFIIITFVIVMILGLSLLSIIRVLGIMLNIMNFIFRILVKVFIMKFFIIDFI